MENLEINLSCGLACCLAIVIQLFKMNSVESAWEFTVKVSDQ